MNFRPSIFLISTLIAPALLLSAGDLSRYREFHLGMTLADVAKQAGIESPEAKAIARRPERVEELVWRTSSSASAASRADSVRQIRFRFYNDHLFEMMVAYDMEHTAGMTDTDMTEALSAIYGTGTAPVGKQMAFNSGYDTPARVIIQWGDTQSLVSLVGYPYGSAFGLIVSSTEDLALALRAIAESDRIDREEAPKRAQDAQAKQAADAETRDEKARLVNKPGFRP
jgi:hypothetical protein